MPVARRIRVPVRQHRRKCRRPLHLLLRPILETDRRRPESRAIIPFRAASSAPNAVAPPLTLSINEVQVLPKDPVLFIAPSPSRRLSRVRLPWPLSLFVLLLSVTVTPVLLATNILTPMTVLSIGPSAKSLPMVGAFANANLRLLNVIPLPVLGAIAKAAPSVRWAIRYRPPLNETPQLAVSILEVLAIAVLTVMLFPPPAPRRIVGPLTVKKLLLVLLPVLNLVPRRAPKVLVNVSVSRLSAPCARLRLREWNARTLFSDLAPSNPLGTLTPFVALLMQVIAA